MKTTKLLTLTAAIFLLSMGASAYAAAEITVAWGEDFGYPDVIEFNGGFQDFFPGGPYVVEVTIANDGDEALAVEEIRAEPAEFRVNRAALDLNPGESAVVELTFETEEAGEFNGELIILSNDPDEGRIEIPLAASAVGPPDIAIDPMEIDFQFPDHEEIVIDVANDGDSNLRFVIDLEIAQQDRDLDGREVRSLGAEREMMRDEAGDLLAEWEMGQNEVFRNLVWDWDNEWIWIISYNEGLARAIRFDHEYNPEEEVLRINPGRCMDGAWANGLLYLPQWSSNAIPRYNSDGQNIGSIQAPFNVVGLAADCEEDRLFLQSGADLGIHVYALRNGGLGNELGVIRNYSEFLNGEQPYGLEWVPKHDDGQLWMVSPGNGHAHQLAVNAERWEVTADVQSFSVFPNGDQPHCSVAHDGHNLWAGGWRNGTIRIYDDGIAELYWIMIDPSEGTLVPGADQNIVLTFDYTGLFFGGDYSANLHFLSNDPDEPDVVCAVHMWFPGYPLRLYWQEELGWPEGLDFNRGFQDIFPRVPYRLTITLPNTGTETVTIDDAAFDSEQFTISPTEAAIEPGDEVDFEITFQADEAGQYEAVGTIWTDDHDCSELVFYVVAEAFNPPQILIGDEWIGVDWRPGEANPDDVALLIVNDAEEGAARLRWEITNNAPWLTCEPEAGFTEPQASSELTLSFDVGRIEGEEASAEVVISSNDPERPEIVVDVFVGENHILPPEPHWGETDRSHSILVTDVRYEGETVADGWEVGVFTEEEFICGVAEWTNDEEGIGIAAYGADQQYPDQFEEGDRMVFKLWDPEADREYDAEANVAEGEIEWHNNALTVLSLDAIAGFLFRVLLRSGWNIISFNFIPGDEHLYVHGQLDVRRLFAQFGYGDGENHAKLVKDERGRFYSTGRNAFNNINFWDLTRGYMVLMDSAMELRFYGQAIDPAADIQLRAGWNMIAYFPTYHLSCARPTYYALSPILDYVIIAKDASGRFALPSRNFSNMIPWRAGQGYQVKVSESVTLNYPAEPEMVMKYEEQDDDGYWKAGRTGRNMSLLLDLELRMQNLELEIGAFTASGLCVGASKLQTPNSKLQTGIAVWGDDPTTPEIDGAVEGEALIFKVLTEGIEREVAVEWSEGDGVYQTDGLAVGRISPPILDASSIPSELSLAGPFPNPFNSMAEIRFSMPIGGDVRLGLFDASGREILPLVSGQFAAGEHTATVDAGGLPTGVYLVRLEASGRVVSAKAVVVK